MKLKHPRFVIPKDVKVIFSQEKISDKHNDSFWYEGTIAELEYKDRRIKIVACGEIRIQRGDKGERVGELVHDGYKSRNSGIKLENDDDLKKIGYNYDDEFYWENNNWFDFLYQLKKWGDDWEDILGQVAHEYDDAIDMAVDWLKDEEWWKDVK